jgi:hypothetical protein
MSISLEIKLKAPIMLHIQTIEQLSILINKIRSHEYKWFGTLHFCVVRKKKVEYGWNAIFREYKKSENNIKL